MQISKSDIEKRVKAIVIDKLGVHESKVTNEAFFIDDLGADSLDVMDFVMIIEEKLELEIPDEDAVKLISVGETIKYLQQRLAC